VIGMIFFYQRVTFGWRILGQRLGAPKIAGLVHDLLENVNVHDQLEAIGDAWGAMDWPRVMCSPLAYCPLPITRVTSLPRTRSPALGRSCSGSCSTPRRNGLPGFL